MARHTYFGERFTATETTGEGFLLRQVENAVCIDLCLEPTAKVNTHETHSGPDPQSLIYLNATHGTVQRRRHNAFP